MRTGESGCASRSWRGLRARRNGAPDWRLGAAVTSNPRGPKVFLYIGSEQWITPTRAHSPTVCVVHAGTAFSRRDLSAWTDAAHRYARFHRGDADACRLFADPWQWGGVLRLEFDAYRPCCEEEDAIHSQRPCGTVDTRDPDLRLVRPSNGY